MDFLTDEEISYLYRNCLAVVMPTYFGPTNIPPLEAFWYEVPLIYSDLPGMREQVQDAAIFVNLDDPLSLSKAIKILIKDNDLRRTLINNGKKILKKNNYTNREEVLISILKRFNSKLRSWKY